MNDRDGNRSNPYKPNPEKCCEACVFKKGSHEAWCTAGRYRYDNLPQKVDLEAALDAEIAALRKLSTP